PAEPLDAANSGTTARLLGGVLAGLPLSVTVIGDPSLSRRPMERVARPLREMGASIVLRDGHLPMTITGGSLAGIDFVPDVPSAQVKGAVLLAGLQARGRTRVTERQLTRNHTELALRRFGATLDMDACTTTLTGGQRLAAVEATVPGDLSSAAFWLAGAAGLPGGAVEIEGVGLNPTRTAVLEVLRRAGADVVVEPDSQREADEPAGRVTVRHGGLTSVAITPAEVPGLIDEIPALAALAAFGGEFSVRGAAELRLKESDRIAALVAGLRALGCDGEEWEDGFAVRGRPPIGGGVADAAGDHRLAMAFAIAALGAAGPSVIRGAGAVDVSYPGFFEALGRLTS
ncbi:MAG TPA: 3-phosphoshikimate 1-carboxyvinyltransferase, partial [Vicinamibacterales bacterium]|nr:3-phosphoshikimate 1-carboxyvinyltransferase [Vicinamibacterales bacterium]